MRAQSDGYVAVTPVPRPSGFSSLLLHLHPKAVPDDALRLSRTFGLGGVAVVLFLVLAASGLLLLTVYEPSPERAYASVHRLVDEVPFGAFVRNAHHWSANGLLLVVLLHLLRVFYQAAYVGPRRVNWFVGLALLVLALASGFTGYLLPWDQLAYWAVTVSTAILGYLPLAGEALLRAARGGSEVGPQTLSRFFVLHVAILPMLMLGLMTFHFWKVRKAGGVILPRSEDRRALPTAPHLLTREAVAALVTVAAVLLLGAVAEAPLLAQANPGLSPNPAKAPWYFMGLQELLVHFHPAFAAAAIPALTLTLLVLLPFLGRAESPSGRWFLSSRGLRMALGAAALSTFLTVSLVVADERVRSAPPWLPALPPQIRGGFLPLAIAAVIVGGLYRFTRRRLTASRLEALQAAFTFLAVAFFILTAIGVFFRGEGMALAWPWPRAAGSGGGGP